MFQSVRNLIDKSIDVKISTIKGKFKEVLNSSGSSHLRNNSTSPNGSNRERRYILTFTQFNFPVPPPLPTIQANPNLFKHYSTEYHNTPFTFFFEEITEPLPIINSTNAEILPVLTDGEPSTGLHPYDFNQVAFQSARDQIILIDIKPHFMHGFPHPMKTFNITPVQDRILQFEQMNLVTSLMNLTYICIQNIKIRGKTKKNFFRKLIQTPNVETLILKDINIGSIQKANLPLLRFCDLSDNKIKNINNIGKLIKFSTKLEILDLSGNPMSEKDESLYLYKLSFSFPHLETLNKKPIHIDDRLKAITLFGPQIRKQNLERIRWELHLDNLAEVRQYRNVEAGWKPHLIQQITLTHLQLQYFYVGSMVNLKSLDLSNNFIQSISSSGLEKCDHLVYINLSNNQIFSGVNNIIGLHIFSMVPSIQSIKLDGNPRLVNYRQQLIYLCRNSKGNNRTIGLLQIDDVPVTRDEKINAIQTIDQVNAFESSSNYLWKLLLIEKYGHKQLQTIPNFLSYVTSLNLSRCNVLKCDVRAFESLELLDLSQNNMSQLTGIDNLMHLRILNLQDNSQLDTIQITQQLLKHEKLESILFKVSENPTHQRGINNSKEYRRTILQATVIKNRNLHLLDNFAIAFHERVQVYLDSGFPFDVVEKYRYFLALTVNCTLPFNRGIYPDQVEPIGKQYDPLSITSLLRLRNWNLTSPSINLSYFENVIEVDLSGNRLVDMLNIGLQNLTKLTKLSLMNNQISNSLLLVAQFLDMNLQSLEMISLRGNPIMSSPNDRLTLIGFMASMKQLTQTLKVLDTEITIYDKVEGWKMVGGSLRDAETFKLNYIAHFKELDIFNTQIIQNLELCDCALEYLDVTPLVNLKTLLLPNNRFRQVSDIYNLSILVELFALDLRQNKLPSMLEIANGIQPLTSLRVLGINGNPFPKNPSPNVSYRIQFISLIPGLFKQHQHPLSILDTTEITPEDILEGSLLVSPPPVSDKKEYLFHISMLRKAYMTPFELLTELDLSNCKLSTLVLRSLSQLVVLSLSDNYITDNNLRDSGINHLSELKALDIRNNHLKDLSHLCKIIDLLSIESLFLEENQCFDKDTPKTRQRFFKKCTNSQTIQTIKYLNGSQITPSDTEKFGKSRRK